MNIFIKQLISVSLVGVPTNGQSKVQFAKQKNCINRITNK